MSKLEHPTFDNIEERQAKWNAKQNAKKCSLFHMLPCNFLSFGDLLRVTLGILIFS